MISKKPIAALEGKIQELRHLTDETDMNIAEEIGKLQTRIEKELSQTYSQLGAWEKVQVARHPDRPKLSQIIEQITDEFVPLSGDRNFAEDYAIIGGLAKFRGQDVVIMGTDKGASTEERIKRNFGMARPEGYRKAIRLMNLADKFNLPVLSFVDTAGAYPGRGAEERGQAEAIARSIQTCLNLSVPMVTAIVGEGGSGGAIALATANRVVMYEHAVYSVISPEGCASILWRSAEFAQKAAEALRLTADDMLKLGVIDEIVKEPLGGAHRDIPQAISDLADMMAKQLDELQSLAPAALKADRRAKYIAIGDRGL